MSVKKHRAKTMTISISKFCAAVVLFLFVSTTFVAAQPIAIVVNKNNPVNEMSYKDLTRVFHGYVSRWKDGQKIILVHRSLDSKPRIDFFQKVMEAKTDKGVPGAKPSVPPVMIEIPGDDAMLKFVSTTPNSIGYLYAHKTSDSVKILKIDNYSPDQPGYPIK